MSTEDQNDEAADAAIDRANHHDADAKAAEAQ